MATRSIRSVTGTPPPARGPLDPEIRQEPVCRNTPACAGTTPLQRGRPRGLAEHPRLRGDHGPHPGTAMAVTGTPPPARGPLFLTCKSMGALPILDSLVRSSPLHADRTELSAQTRASRCRVSRPHRPPQGAAQAARPLQEPTADHPMPPHFRPSTPEPAARPKPASSRTAAQSVRVKPQSIAAKSPNKPTTMAIRAADPGTGSHRVGSCPGPSAEDPAPAEAPGLPAASGDQPHRYPARPDAGSEPKIRELATHKRSLDSEEGLGPRASPAA